MTAAKGLIHRCAVDGRAWSDSSIRRVKNAATAPSLLAFCALFSIIVVGCLSESTLSPQETEEDVYEHLERGAPLQEILDYLDTAGIERSPDVGRAGQWSDLVYRGIDPETRVVAAVIRGDALSAVQLYFLLDDQARFDDLIVVEKLPLFYRHKEGIKVAA